MKELNHHGAPPTPAHYSAAVRDGNLITGTSAGCAVDFGLQLIEALKGPEAAQTVERQIVRR